MKIEMKESVMIKPMEETPSGSLWLSSLDLVMPAAYHTLFVYFYRYDGSAAADFFDATDLKAALSRALVEFYPFAGRLKKDHNGRIEINCNGEGVLFSVAECDGTIDDLGGFSPRPDISLARPHSRLLSRNFDLPTFTCAVNSVQMRWSELRCCKRSSRIRRDLCSPFHEHVVRHYSRLNPRRPPFL